MQTLACIISELIMIRKIRGRIFYDNAGQFNGVTKVVQNSLPELMVNYPGKKGQLMSGNQKGDGSYYFLVKFLSKNP